MTGDDSTYRAMTRRDFMRIGGLAMAAAAALLAGCRPSGSEQTAFDDSAQSDVPAAVATATKLVQCATATPPALPTATPLPQQNLGVACPFGLVNDPFAGRCKRYVDANGDGYCDNSVLGSGNMKVRD
jgi:hypothetical protein